MTKILAALCCLAGVSGCFSAGYLAQATRGQLELLEHRRPIDDAIADQHVPPATRTLLAEVSRIKAFAEARGLKATRNYTRYVDLKRPAAVWVVSASSPLSFTAVTWWFPIVGSVPYLGWFKISDAKRFATELQAQALDVNLRGASAYSTLGFFEDPILSTMLSDDSDALSDLANTILHESLHATFYVPRRTDLSESVASFVGDELTREYLDTRFGPGSAERDRYDKAVVSGVARRKLMLDTKAALTQVYASAASDQEKRMQKGVLLGRLRQALKTKRAINNATLMELSNYGSGQAELSDLLKCLGNDWPRFFSALEAWAKAPKPAFATLREQCQGSK